jgi:hypothetical protein
MRDLVWGGGDLMWMDRSLSTDSSPAPSAALIWFKMSLEMVQEEERGNIDPSAVSLSDSRLGKLRRRVVTLCWALNLTPSSFTEARDGALVERREEIWGVTRNAGRGAPLPGLSLASSSLPPSVCLASLPKITCRDERDSGREEASWYLSEHEKGVVGVSKMRRVHGRASIR